MKLWAEESGLIDVPQYNLKIIGWDFLFLSQKQINVFHMHGYMSACILPENFKTDSNAVEIVKQNECRYAMVTIKNYKKAPFDLIPLQTSC